MKPQTSLAPPGAFVELGLELINEGKFKQMVEAKPSQAVEGLMKYEKESGDMTATAEVTVKIKLQRPKGSNQFIDILYHAKTQVPVIEAITTVKQAGDKLLCQPSGSNDGNPDQQLFYDACGQIIGGVDTETGQQLDEREAKQVAGKIGRSAAG